MTKTTTNRAQNGDRFEAVTCGCPKKTLAKVPHSLIEDPNVSLTEAAERVGQKQKLDEDVARAACVAVARKLHLHLDWTA